LEEAGAGVGIHESSQRSFNHLVPTNNKRSLPDGLLLSTKQRACPMVAAALTESKQKAYPTGLLRFCVLGGGGCLPAPVHVRASGLPHRGALGGGGLPRRCMLARWRQPPAPAASPHFGVLGRGGGLPRWSMRGRAASPCRGALGGGGLPRRCMLARRRQPPAAAASPHFGVLGRGGGLLRLCVLSGGGFPLWSMRGRAASPCRGALDGSGSRIGGILAAACLHGGGLPAVMCLAAADSRRCAQ
jgi:hypothetical protein